MTITFTKFVTDCLMVAGDWQVATWSRISHGLPWAKEALQAFPILRPMLDDHTNGASIVYSYAMPTDFREIISVEYPISQQPPVYLIRKNRLDPNFYGEAGYYDVDHDYSTGSGWLCYVSGGVAAAAHIKTQYLANHPTNLADDSTAVVTVPDEYEPILIAYFITRAWRERLGNTMRDPTAHTSTISQITEMVHKADDNYLQMVQQAQAKLADSKITPHREVDKFDRVY
jgi:hypothetical protein